MTFKIKIIERLLPLFFISCLLFSAFSYADEYPVQPYIIFDSFSYSETVSIKSTFDSWKSDKFKSGERQWTWNWFELGVQYQHWGIGIVKRYDYNLQFSKDTAEFYWLVANKKDLPNNRQYNLDLQVNALHSSGIRLSYADSFNDSFNYRVGLTYLEANYMIEGEIIGDATADSESSLDYDFQAELDYHYIEDDLFDRVVDKPQGKGFALDLEFSYQVTFDTHWQFQVRDLLARLYWQNAPYTEGNTTSNRKEYDEDGYVKFNPVLTGYEGITQTYVQILQPRWYSKINHQLSTDYAAVLQYRYQYGHGLYSVGANYQLSYDNNLEVSYWPINQALELSWNYHKVQLALVADGFEFTEANTLWLSLSYAR